MLGWLVVSVVASDDVSALRSWLAAGADFNMADYTGRTPLHVAAAHRRPDHVAFLLQHGADPSAVDLSGLTPLDVARRDHQPAPDIVALLAAAAVENGTAVHD